MIEVTTTVPGAAVGTLFGVATAQKCLDAGAAFLTQPGPDHEVVDFAMKRGVGKGSFLQVPLIASGSADQETAGDFIRAGAAALGIGRHLIHPDAIKRRESGWIRKLSRRDLSLVAQARELIER